MTYICNCKTALFDEKEAKRIFENNERYLNCPIKYDILRYSDWFFTVLNDKGETVGICYILMDKYKDELVPFYSGAFDRKTNKEVKEAHKLLLDIAFHYFDKIYTWTPHLHARIFNKRAGMRELDNNVFIMERENFKKEEK